jgi:hypothetical protein
MWLNDELIASDLAGGPVDRDGAGALLPDAAEGEVRAYIPRHPLRREIIATALCSTAW